jgi:hypothetical protein
VRSQNLMLACSMPHASDWLLAPPIAGLGLNLQSDVFRTAMKFRLGLPLFEKPFLCPTVSSGSGQVCGEQVDVLGDHALCCHHSSSLVFRHNKVRDILKHAAIGAGLSAVDREEEPGGGLQGQAGDISVQQYHRGFATSAFDVTISHPLQKKYIEIAMEEGGVAAADAHDRKLLKSLEVCEKEGIHFVPLAWESTGGATETVHETVRKWTKLRVLVVVTLRT